MLKATRVYACEATAAHAMPTAAIRGTSSKATTMPKPARAVIYKVELVVQLIRQQQLEDHHRGHAIIGIHREKTRNTGTESPNLGPSTKCTSNGAPK